MEKKNNSPKVVLVTVIKDLEKIEEIIQKFNFIWKVSGFREKVFIELNPPDTEDEGEINRFYYKAIDFCNEIKKTVSKINIVEIK